MNKVDNLINEAMKKATLSTVIRAVYMECSTRLDDLTLEDDAASEVWREAATGLATFYRRLLELGL